MYAFAIFLPLIGCLLAGLFGRPLGDRGAQLVTCGAMLAAAAIAAIAFYEVALGGAPRDIKLFTWIDSGALEANWALRFDTLSATMVAMITLVSSMIHIYSIGYMEGDPSVPRFMSYLSLFTFAMLMLVTADNLVQLFFGWEGVGLTSYLLIGFRYERSAANAAALKAFLVNRVGDLGFMLGICGVFYAVGSVEYDTIFSAVPSLAGREIAFLGMRLDLLTTLCLLLFIGAMGKSAQLGLHTWLPDAMEGPTPVSALIHAATMVTAGVFMVVRLSPLFEAAPAALDFVTLVGAATAFFAATVGLVQTDIKRVIAYSTCSQLGYMFFACGIGAYPAAMFHLITHAFFKALLFLCAGAVIHGVHHEQDLNRMGGLAARMPVTAALMWIGSLSLAGMPMFAGYYSKDLILESAFAANTPVATIAFWLGLAGVLMTAFYSWRLLALAFHGQTRAKHDVYHHAHDAPAVMIAPLFVLAVGAVIGGWALHGLFVGEGMDKFWGDSVALAKAGEIFEAAHLLPGWVPAAPVLLALGGIVLALVLYLSRPDIPAAVAQRAGGLYRFLLNKWYFDELYDMIFVQPALALGRGLWKGGDEAVINAAGPDGVAAATLGLAMRASRLQTGRLYHYAFAMLAALVAALTYFLLSGE
ncbi:MAG: NADH-quinone oxidoreductase subunit L [Alphaproteobacteria bacterium]|nr:NADH-quinone oxidoreductase subunit L [Alphaproteobacteria bacterium]